MASDDKEVLVGCFFLPLSHDPFIAHPLFPASRTTSDLTPTLLLDCEPVKSAFNREATSDIDTMDHDLAFPVICLEKGGSRERV